MSHVTTRSQTLSTHTNGLLNWIQEIRISKQDYSCCVAARQAATYHRPCRLTSIPSLIKPKAHRLLLGMALDPCSKLGLVPAALLALVQLMVGAASDLMSSTLSHLTHMSNEESLSADLHLHSPGSLVPVRR